MWSSWGTLAASVVFYQCLSVWASAGAPIYTYRDHSGTQVSTTKLDSSPEKYWNRIVQLYPHNSSTHRSVPAAQQAPRQVRTVTATGEYRMTDHDTRTTAVRRAVEAAKRSALEQVCTYLESVTEIKEMELTIDETRTYTAGIVVVMDEKITTRLEADTVVIQANLTAQVDPDEVAQAIMTLRLTHEGTRIYSYVDDSGTQTFTNVPGSIPDRYRSRAHLLLLNSSPAPLPVPEVEDLPLEQVER
jgi:hypothetical protein